MTLRPRPWLDVLEPYRPGRHAPTAAGSMASNESPLGVNPAVVAAVSAAATHVHHYPDPLATELRHRLAEQHGVDPEQILVGNGSDELIYLLTWAYAAHGGRVVCADPPYRIDEISAVVAGAQVSKVPLRDWTHDLTAMAGVEAELAYVCNPHNPTGTVCPRADLERFVAESRAGLVVVDEAYVDFADDPDDLTAVAMAAAGRAAVVRTFSKIHGLAGMRVGYLVAARPVIETLRAIRAPFSVGALAQAAAVAALTAPDYRDRVRRHTLDYRGRLTRLFRAAGYEVVPSQANFVLVATPHEEALTAVLADGGVAVRPGSALGHPGSVRVSVPSREGFALLEAALVDATALTAPTPGPRHEAIAELS